MLLQIPIKGGSFIEVDTDAITNDSVYAKLLVEGYKAVLNSKMSKLRPFTKLSGDDLAEEQTKALDIARTNLADLEAGKFKFPGDKKAKAGAKREEINEAMRLARDFLLDQLRAHKISIASVPKKDITAAAKSLIEANSGDNEYMRKARENLANRESAPSNLIDLAALGINPVAKPKKAKTSDGTLSAAQAGRTKKHVAGKSRPATASPSAVLAGLTGTAAPAHTH